ncbi:MAG: hypothetical protein K6E13_11095 [Lachnospiraceae bacterium]|nr:hypothetical protein [Lachnospiraceae bacterium]
MRIWVREWKDNHLIKDTTITDERDDTRTHKVFNALDEACMELDLGRPIWLDNNIKEFKKNASTKFRKDSFIEEIPFDFLEFTVIEED